jgi:hypothetical protein
MENGLCTCDEKLKIALREIESLKIELQTLKQTIKDFSTNPTKTSASSKVEKNQKLRTNNNKVSFNNCCKMNSIKLCYEPSKNRIRHNIKLDNKYTRIDFVLMKFFKLEEDGEEVIRKISSFIKSELNEAILASTKTFYLEYKDKRIVISNNFIVN